MIKHSLFAKSVQHLSVDTWGSSSIEEKHQGWKRSWIVFIIENKTSTKEFIFQALNNFYESTYSLICSFNLENKIAWIMKFTVKEKRVYLELKCELYAYKTWLFL